MTKEELYSEGVFTALMNDLDGAITQQYTRMNQLTRFLAEDRSMDVEFRGKVIGLAMDLNSLMGIEKELLKKVEEIDNAGLR